MQQAYLYGGQLLRFLYFVRYMAQTRWRNGGLTTDPPSELDAELNKLYDPQKATEFLNDLGIEFREASAVSPELFRIFYDGHAKDVHQFLQENGTCVYEVDFSCGYLFRKETFGGGQRDFTDALFKIAGAFRKGSEWQANSRG